MKILAAFIAIVAIGIEAHAENYAFPLRENEELKWIGGSVGIDWADIQMSSDLIYGTSLASEYADPTAILTGEWNADQAALAVIRVAQTPKDCCKEVELRLRTTIKPHSITGYEVICSIVPSSPYIQIVRWDGGLGKFAYISKQTSNFCKHGDVLSADIIGATLTVYLNDKEVLRGRDDRFKTGSPGVGFYNNIDNDWATFGFSKFIAGSMEPMK